MFPLDRSERLAIVKERHRVITEKLLKIVDGDAIRGFDKSIYPAHGERVAAANAILKWDMALFYVEEQITSIELRVVNLPPESFSSRSLEVSKKESMGDALPAYLSPFH